MKIKNILISQPHPAILEKSPFQEIVLKHRVELTFHPFIRVEGVSLKEFRSQRIEIFDHTAVIFTSRTTIDSFFRICEEARFSIPETMKYFCNTEAVALYLQKYIVYRKRKIFFADGSFANFMELLLKHKNEQFLLTLSEPHKPEMPMGMEKLRLNFSKVILARTVSAELSAIDVHQYDVLVFYSPSEISALVSHFQELNGRCKIATFGHGTTRAAIDEGLIISVMAPTPEAPSMTKALELYVARVNAGEQVPIVTLEGDSPDQAYIQAREVKVAKRRPSSKSTTPIAPKDVVAKSDTKSTTKTTAKVKPAVRSAEPPPKRASVQPLTTKK